MHSSMPVKDNTEEPSIISAKCVIGRIAIWHQIILLADLGKPSFKLSLGAAKPKCLKSFLHKGILIQFILNWDRRLLREMIKAVLNKNNSKCRNQTQLSV